MGYLIELEVYQGPFDLLLDLIAQNEIDIWDIPIATITEQYLDYLYSLREQNLAVTGEFLVMAATLIRIKSRLLLPEEGGDEKEEEETDPREELVGQLLRYRFFKEAALFLRDKYEGTLYFYPRAPTALKFKKTPIYTNLLGDLTLAELGRVYDHLFWETQSKTPLLARAPKVSFLERLGLIRLRMVGKPRIRFSQLLSGHTPTEIVITFLAVLELVRLGEVQISQKESFGEINIEPKALDLEVHL